MTPRTRRRIRWIVAGIGLGLGTLAIPIQPATGAQVTAHQILGADFNDDGTDDLAIGVPGEALGGGEDGADGAVNVIYGTFFGLTSNGADFWHQGVANANDSAQDGDQFGRALATGDFDGDGFTDLAVGVPGEKVDGLESAGGVHVLFGGSGGLGIGGDRFFTRATSGIAGQPGQGDFFGLSLAAADFDGDGVDDLAVGMPTRDVEGGSGPDDGAVQVLYGIDGVGLTGGRDEVWTKGSPGVNDDVESGDNFGFYLAGGQFGRTGNRADLAIGVPGDDIGGDDDAGSVHLLFGRDSGLEAEDDQRLAAGDAFVGPEPEDHEGASLAAGDFDGDGDDDLASGIPGEEFGKGDDISCEAGAVRTYRASGAGLATWNALSDFGGGGTECGDTFGASLTSGRFDQGAKADLAIGVPGEDLAANGDGNVVVIPGAPDGLSSLDSQFWNQGTGTIDGAPADADAFGTGVVSGDFGEGSRRDLVVGTVFDDAGANGSGSVNVIFGTAEGLDDDRDELWSQGSPGIPNAPETGDCFGVVVFLAPACGC